jgi:hypothetical protein
MLLRTRVWLACALLGACAAEPERDREARIPPSAQQNAAAGGASGGAMPDALPDHGAAGIAGRVAAAPPAGSVLAAGECVTTGTIEASLRPANLLFLIDRSASLNCNLPPLTDSAACEANPERADATAPTKWEIVRRALSDAIGGLPASVSAAITYFSNDDRCGVQSAPHVPMAPLDAAQRATLIGSLDAVEPKGGTPIVGGLILAYKQLNPDQTPQQPFGNRFVVLLTDGQEGCAPQETERLLDEELPKAQRARITTFVVGVPGSEVARGFLSRLAFAGGAPRAPDCDHASSDPAAGDCHFDMTREADLASGLRDALARIADRALGCEFDVPQPAAGDTLDYARVNVVYTAAAGGAEQLIAQDTRAACDAGADGWQYNADRSKVLLCGAACANVRRAASIRIALGCESMHVD